MSNKITLDEMVDVLGVALPCGNPVAVLYSDWRRLQVVRHLESIGFLKQVNDNPYIYIPTEAGTKFFKMQTGD